MKNYWLDVILPARKEMITLIKARVIENGGKVSYIGYNDDYECLVLNLSYDGIDGNRIQRLCEVVIKNGELFFEGCDAYDNFAYSEIQVSADFLCEVCESIDEAIKYKDEE